MRELFRSSIIVLGTLLASLSYGADTPKTTGKGRYVLVGWNDLGMHCVDGNDYSVFSILPPFNNIHAQLIDPQGKLVKTPGSIRLTYQAVADPAGSINRTSIGKTNFWEYVNALFGVKPVPDMGLAGNAMPGPANTPQAMKWDAKTFHFTAEGVPILPYPDGGKPKNYYPLMRLTALDGAGKALATTDVVLPVSDEMACSNCHEPGSPDASAMPKGGWKYDPKDPSKNYKLNILAKHDDNHSTSLLTRQPVLCASCHASNALGTKGAANVPPLTQALHNRHAAAWDTALGMRLGDAANREACYRCHPGSATKCLRGAMGNAGMQCQSCHGNMKDVGSAARQGWIDEPACENCHTGTAVKYNGQIRQVNVFDHAGGALRQPADRRFAVTAGALYKTAAGHGGLACEACHGSTHAEYPSSHVNDNLQIQKLQGHTGTLAECTTCHAKLSSTAVGPHGMHVIGAAWVSKHGDLVENQGSGACRDCHGGDLRGTVLSAALTARSFSTEKGTKSFTKGHQIGCYSCHNGPNP